MALNDIDNFVWLILENRSFDHMLGYRNPAGWEAGFANRDPVSGAWLAPSLYAGADAVIPDPPHDAVRVPKQMSTPAQGQPGAGGFVAQYVDRYLSEGKPAPPDRSVIMRINTAANVPAFDFFANQFAVCDNWHCPLPTSTQPNKLMALAGYSQVGDTDSATLQPQPVIYDWLNARKAKVDWGVYASGGYFPFLMLMKNWRWPIWWQLFGAGGLDPHRKFKRFQTAFAGDWAKAPSGPKVWFLEPEYTDSSYPQGRPNDDHPPTGIAGGQAYALAIYRILISNPARWARTMFIISYDEHGGFFDHKPPLKITDQAGTLPCATTGPRVPALVISPQVGPGQVFSAPLDHTCVLQMLAQRFDGAGASYSDRVKARTDQGLGSLADVLSVAPSAAPRAPAPPGPVTLATAALHAAAVPATTVAVAEANPAHTEPDGMTAAFRSAVVSAEASRRARQVQAPEGWKALTSAK